MKRDRSPNAVADLSPWHPLHGRGLRHQDICQTCKGYGVLFGLANTQVQCCGTGLASDSRSRAALMHQQAIARKTNSSTTGET
jgi:hypothetical protein